MYFSDLANIKVNKLSKMHIIIFQFAAKGCSRKSSPSSIIAPVVPKESIFAQLVGDMLDSQTMMWNSMTILYDSTQFQETQSIEEMILHLKSEIPIITFDLNTKPAHEIFNMKQSIGKNFFIISKRDSAETIYNLVKRIGIFTCISNNHINVDK